MRYEPLDGPQIGELQNMFVNETPRFSRLSIARVCVGKLFSCAAIVSKRCWSVVINKMFGFCMTDPFAKVGFIRCLPCYRCYCRL